MRKLSLFLIFLGFVYFIQFSSENESSSKFDLPYTVNAEEASEDLTPIIEMTQGDVNAPIEMVEYAAFTCPFCAKFHAEAYPNLKADYIEKGLVRFIYREVYFHKFGVWASLIARCTGRNKFFGIVDEVYRKHAQWTGAESDMAVVTELKKIGLLAGLDEPQLETCLQDGVKLKNLINWYQENAKRDEIKSTPTLVINGEKHSYKNYDQLTTVLDEILGKS